MISFIFTFYLILNPNETMIRLIIKKNYKYFVLQKTNENSIQNLFFDFLVQNYFRNNFLKNEKNENLINRKTELFFVDQSDAAFYKTRIQLKYGTSMGATLIYGYGACESTNGILGLRLSKDIKNVELFSLYDVGKNTSPHTLLKIRNQAGPYFTDITNNNTNNKILKYSLDNTKFNNKMDIKFYSRDFYAARFNPDLFENGFVIKKYGFFSYINKGYEKLLHLIPNLKFNQKLVQRNLANDTKIIDKNFDSDNIQDNDINQSLINLFIDARISHINGNLNDAYQKYNKILDTKCLHNICKTTKILLTKKDLF